MAWNQETEEVYLKGVHNIIDKCEDLVDGGCMYDDEHITEKDLLLEAIGCMDEQSKKDFYRVLTKIEAEGYPSEFTDDDGNPISEEEQERANHMEDRLNKGE